MTGWQVGAIHLSRGGGPSHFTDGETEAQKEKGRCRGTRTTGTEVFKVLCRKVNFSILGDRKQKTL